MSGLLLMFEVFDVFLEFVVLFLGVLHNLLYKLDASILIFDLHAKSNPSYLSSTVFSMF